MKFGTIGPLKDFFADIASPLTDWLFMLGMLGVGVGRHARHRPARRGRGRLAHHGA